MPVTDIQKLSRDSLQTWEQAFENVDKTSDAFHKLVDEFVEFVGDWKEFSDIRRDMLADYIENLDDVKNHWSDINKWVSDNSDTLDTYVGSLTDIRDLFQSIAGEIGGVRRQTLDNVNVVRSLARLANDNLAAIKQEGGLSESIVRSLDKRSARLQEEYKARLQLIGVERDLSNIELVQKSEKQKLQIAQSNLRTLEALRAAGTRLTAEDREQLRILKEQVNYHTSNLELINEANRKAVEGLDIRIRKQADYLRIQRRGKAEEAGENALGANSINAVSKLFRRFGLGEEANDLDKKAGEFWTNRVSAVQSVDFAKDKKSLADKALKSAVEERDVLRDRKDAFMNSTDLHRGILEIQKADLLREQGLPKKILDTGRRENGQFASREELDSAFKYYSSLQKEIQKLDEKIKQTVESQKEFNKELLGAELRAKRAGDVAKAAADDLQQAEDQKKAIFNESFDLAGRVKDYIVEGYLHLGKWGGPLGAILALTAAIFHQLLQFDKQAVETKRVIGQWADYSATANTKFVAGTEVLKTMVQLGQQFKINPVQVFSPEELANITKAQKFTGMTVEAAGNLAVQSKISGQNAGTYRDAIAKGVNSANALNHSVVNLSTVQNDVLTTSRAIALSYGKNTAELAKAAGAAASLNMNLEQIQEISRSLMNFESSISAEMEAQLLTGMQLNLAKAREYALNNDLNGVAREIANQGMNAARFSHMNYIQQESMAKALGMSREQMAKMLIMQEINSGLTAKQVAAMTGMRRQDIEALSAQEKWQTMKQKFLESLVPLLEPILQTTTEILRPLGAIVGFITKLVGKVTSLWGWTEKWPTWLRGIYTLSLTFIAGVALKLRGLLGLGKGIGKVFRGIGKIFKGLKLPTFSLGGGLIEGAGGAAKGVTGVGGAFKALGRQLPQILKGALVIGLMIGAIKGLGWALKEFEGIEWKQFGIMAASLGTLIGSMAIFGALMSGPLAAGVFLGVAALGVLVLYVDSVAKSFQKLTAVSGDELQSIATGIRSIAGAIGELSGKLGDLSVNKLNRLGKVFKKLKNANIPIYAEVQSEIPRESQETTRDSIEASAKEIVIKTAQVQASAQQISVEQKAADLTKIEEKMNSIKKAIEDLPRIMEFSEFDRRYQLG